MKIVVMAALCLALLAGCAKPQAEAPESGFVQMVNPLVTVESLEEMEAKLGYAVPALDKDVASYIVLVYDGAPQQGRIRYADGADFDMKRGTGDVSGIYGGTLEKEETVGGIAVSVMTYDGIRYALWEKDGFTYCLTGGDDLLQEVAVLIEK